MPAWNEILNETKEAGSIHDVIRRRYLKSLFRRTKRNTILYYSGWLQKPNLMKEPAINLGISDADKNGFMSVIHKLDRTKGLDLILHTPGGDMAATESLVDYLHSMFGNNIRAIIPQLAMSGGTIMALACNKIIMGKESSIGPIDPQFGTMAASGLLEEFEREWRLRREVGPPAFHGQPGIVAEGLESAKEAEPIGAVFGRRTPIRAGYVNMSHVRTGGQHTVEALVLDRNVVHIRQYLDAWVIELHSDRAGVFD